MSYLQKLQNALLHKYQNESDTRRDVIDFFRVYDEPEAKLLLSLFVLPIPEKREYYYRVGEELRLIIDKKFVKVFLQVREILEMAGDMPHIIRGSAGSCLICYLMGITYIDPVKYKISSARFMHSQRESIPDIDIDWSHTMRESIYEKIFARWEGRVARISNHVYYKKKSALKEAIRRHGHHKFLPKDFDLDEIFPDVQDRDKIENSAEEIEGTFNHYSLHCGIVIFDCDIPEELYLKDIKAGKKIAKQIKLNKDETEDGGFIKIDILSNRGISQLWEISREPIWKYPTDHGEVYDFLSRDNNNIGITYAESRGMRKLFLELAPKSISDIGCVLALIRPAASGDKGEFIKYCENLIPESHYKDFIIYDDDAIDYIADLLEIDTGSADLYRKAFSKHNYKKIREFKAKLAESHPEFTLEKRNNIVEKLNCLGEYSFCKSHSISYAQLVWCLGYQKYYHPHEFWCATINNCGGSSFRKWVYYREAVASGLQLTIGKPPWKIRNGRLIGPNTINKFRYDDVTDYFHHGFWINQDFLSDMYYHENITVVKNKPLLQGKFKGLIACYRVYNTEKKRWKIDGAAADLANDEMIMNKRKKKFITFVTLGYDNGKYIDVVLWGATKLAKCHVIQGYGVVNAGKTSWIAVEKWQQVFLESK